MGLAEVIQHQRPAGDSAAVNVGTKLKLLMMVIMIYATPTVSVTGTTVNRNLCPSSICSTSSKRLAVYNRVQSLLLVLLSPRPFTLRPNRLAPCRRIPGSSLSTKKEPPLQRQRHSSARIKMRWPFEISSSTTGPFWPL